MKRASLALITVCVIGLFFATKSLAQKPLGGGAAGNQSTSQTSAATPSAGGGGATSAGSSSLAGISYSRDTWEQISVLPPPETFGLGKDDIHKSLDNLQGHSFRKDVLVYCYDVKQNLSAGLPLIFEPTPAPTAEDNVTPAPPKKPKHGYELCRNQKQTQHGGVSLVMGRYLVLRVDMSRLPDNVRARIQTINLNVTSAAGTPFNSQRGSSLNPSLARPRMALLSGRPFPCPKVLDDPDLDDHDYAPPFGPYDLDGKPLSRAFCPPGRNPKGFVANPSVIYLVWPSPLVADTLPTISANLIYAPVAPDLSWQPNTFYPAGSIVIPRDAAGQTNGHYYMALESGTSAPLPIGPASPAEFIAGAVNMPEFPDPPLGSGLTWQKMGPLCQQVQPSVGGGAQPPAPGVFVYTPGNLYRANQLVIPPIPGNCHYYRAIVTPPAVSARAAAIPPQFTTTIGAVFQDATGSSLSWQDMGLLTVPAWAGGVAYAAGALVTPSPSNGFFYQATNAGVSGAFQPAFPVADGAPPVSESVGLVWLDAGAGPTQPGSIKNLKKWTAATPYALGDGVLDNATGHYYVAIQPGISGGSPPTFVVPAPQIVLDGPLRWQDIGTATPASTTLGTQPADVTVNAYNLTLPQAHSLAWFNLASGVVVSSLRPPSVTTYTGVGPGQQASATNPDVCPTGVSSCSLYTVSKGSHLVDPVLGLTVYALRPFDVERPFRLLDLLPAPTFNLSVLSPTTNFHIGFASEFFIRNLQLTYGVSLAQETRPLGTPTAMISGQPAYLSTVKQFNKGGFFGFTLNITGLINVATGLVP